MYKRQLDYCAGWYAKAAAYLADTEQASFAFVTTNSITQGQQVAALFSDLLEDGWTVLFAHRTFTWTSEAANAAAVHCVIVGMVKERRSSRPLFSYRAGAGTPEMQPVSRINPYLVEGPDVFVQPRSKPLSTDLPGAVFGSMANDGGNLLLDTEGHALSLIHI